MNLRIVHLLVRSKNVILQTNSLWSIRDLIILLREHLQVLDSDCEYTLYLRAGYCLSIA